MRQARKRLLGVGIAAGLALAVGLATVGLSAASGSQATPPRAAQVTSSATPCTSASYALTVNATSPSGAAWSIAATGQVDFNGDAATATVTLPSSFPVGVLAGTTLQIELVGTSVYVEVPPALSEFVGGAPWVSIALPSDGSSEVNAVFSQLASWCGNVQSIVTALGSHGGPVTSLGSSSIDNGYAKGTMVKRSGNRIRHLLRLPRSLTGDILTGATTPIDVWANSQGQLVRLSIGTFLSLNVTNIDQ
ncbi:MAG TPA: hypothetical protein VED63_07385, partial [Acidimicrobiales bacterium]|nr:hypothetical protein [Acidimicrobiales bacterium]